MSRPPDTIGDYAPYLYHTDDYGATWRSLIKGIDRGHFTRVIRADRNTPGLLYAGTEFGLYVSTNDGANWRSFQLNLPEVPITDLALKDNDIIVATQGRSFWLLDDLDVLWQGLEDFDAVRPHLFQPHPTVGYGGGNAPNPPLPALTTPQAFALTTMCRKEWRMPRSPSATARALKFALMMTAIWI